jgi:hypothetical protein
MTAGAGIPPAHWPRDRWISPSVLKAYRDCARQVRLKHIERVTAPPISRIDFTKGNATHVALKQAADRLARGEEPPTDEQVLAKVRKDLPREGFPSDEEWHAHVRDVMRWIARGRRYIQRPTITGWVQVERPLKRPWTLFRDAPPVTVSARPDVIVLHDDGPAPRIEIIDYKTGAKWFDEMPALILRLVARDLLDDLVGNVDDVPVQFTYLWLDHGEVDTIDLTPEYIGYYWDDVFESMRALVREAEWAPNPSPRCHYCPYFGATCPEKIPVDPWSDPRHG